MDTSIRFIWFGLEFNGVRMVVKCHIYTHAHRNGQPQSYKYTYYTLPPSWLLSFRVYAYTQDNVYNGFTSFSRFFRFFISSLCTRTMSLSPLSSFLLLLVVWYGAVLLFSGIHCCWLDGKSEPRVCVCVCIGRVGAKEREWWRKERKHIVAFNGELADGVARAIAKGANDYALRQKHDFVWPTGRTALP